MSHILSPHFAQLRNRSTDLWEVRAIYDKDQPLNLILLTEAGAKLPRKIYVLYPLSTLDYRLDVGDKVEFRHKRHLVKGHAEYRDMGEGIGCALIIESLSVWKPNVIWMKGWERLRRRTRRNLPQ